MGPILRYPAAGREIHGQPEGTVLRQSPSSGKQDKGSTVTIFVAKAPATPGGEGPGGGDTTTTPAPAPGGGTSP